MTSYLKIARKRLTSLTSSAPSDPIFRSWDGPSESVGKGSGIVGKARGKKRGEGWVGKGKKKRGEGWVGKGKKKCGGWGGWVMTSWKK